MVNILLNGCNGRMGKFVAEAAEKSDDCRIIAGVDTFCGSDSSFRVYEKINEVTENSDVVVDFSNPSAFDDLIDYCLIKKLPVVICTTGLSPEQIDRINTVSQTIPVFYSANMSLGVNLLIELAKKAAKILGDEFDIEIVEAHHNQKLDAPSGTALMIANAVNSEQGNNYNYEYNRQSKREKRSKNEIGIHSVRGGTIVGEHEVIFAGNNEVLKISHSAESRALFATGAINAAKFICVSEPGLYKMSDLMKD